MDNFFEPPLIGACIFGQSGGPTAVINASAYGVIRTALDSDVITNVYGAAYGIKGVLNDELYDMAEEEDYELKLLLNTPSSELGSCRYKIADPEVDDTDYKRILEIFKKYDVRYFFYNGGNDSMDTCNKISRYMEKVGYECRVMGVPKTIDNDLFGTDHCPGYGSAAKFIATSCMEVGKDTDVYNTDMVTVIEIMGRHAGWLTASAALATEYGNGCGTDELSCRNVVCRLNNGDVRNGAQNAQILYRLMACAVICRGNAAVRACDLDIEIGVAHLLSDHFAHSQRAEHRIGHDKRDLAG